MRKLGIALCAALAAAAVVAAAAIAAPAVQLTEAAGATFPERAFVLSLPNARTLTAANVHVAEDGQDVVDLSVVPASEAGKKTFGVVLVVDASESMQGKPIAQALAAEKVFATRRNANQQLGIVVFNNDAKIAQPLTTSSSKIDAALAAAPPVAYGTHIYDAIAKAQAMLKHANIGAGSIVLLSDGADTGSAHTAAQVATAARAAHVRLFTIGLQSPKFQPHTLESLAEVGGGQYSLAKTTADLGPLFDQLGQRLSRDYLVQYKSLAAPKERVKVGVQVDGVGAATAAYETPALPPHAVASPYHPSLTSRILGSRIVMLILVLIGAAAAALLVFAIAQPRNSGLPQRMAEFVSIPELQSQERGRAGAAAPGPDGAEQPRGMIARLDDTLEIAEINIRAVPLIALTIVGTILLFVLLLAATGSAWWALLGLLAPLAVRWWVGFKLERRRKAFAEQLPDSLQVISAALRSGQSFAASLAAVVDSSGEPMKSELQSVVADEQRGIPLDKAMAVVVRRMANRDLEQVALVAELQREAGGNAAEVIDRVAETVRERFELRRLINTLTVQGRMSRWIVTALPIALVILVSLLNPHYEHPLAAHLLGKVMIVIAVLLVIGGSLVIKKIVDIKV